MKKTKLILIIIFSVLFILISYFTFNENIRRSALTYIFVTHDYYQFKKLTYDIQNRNFSNVSKKIVNYINISKKFSSEKSYMIPGIYNSIELAVSKAIEQEDYNFLEKPLTMFVDMEPNLYKPNVWLARALSDNNYDKAISLLKKAIAISPTEEDAYREILRISQIYKNKKLVTEYCDIYFKSQIGGNTNDYDYGYLFDSNNLKKFAIKLKTNKNIDNNFYYQSGIELKKFTNYEFFPKKPVNLDGIDLYFSFLPGIKIIIKEIILHSSNDKKIIMSKDLLVTSNSSYIEEDLQQILIYSLKEGDEVIRVTFKENVSSLDKIEKIVLNINFQKMKLINNSYCKLN